MNGIYWISKLLLLKLVCLFSSLFMLMSKKILSSALLACCGGNTDYRWIRLAKCQRFFPCYDVIISLLDLSPILPWYDATNAENVLMWWLYHVQTCSISPGAFRIRTTYLCCAKAYALTEKCDDVLTRAHFPYHRPFTSGFQLLNWIWP